MKRSKLAVILLACPVLWACSPGDSPREAAAAERPPPALTGAWHATRVLVESGPDAGAHTVDVQPAIYVFAKTHYAITAVNGFQARAYLSDESTEEEQGVAFTPYTGSAGVYTSDADKLTLTPQVAKDPGDMIVPQPAEYELLWVEDRVLLTTTAPDGGTVSTQLTRLTDDALKVSPEARRLKGVWRRTEMIVGAGPNAGPHLDDMQPGYYIFDPPYFSGNFVSGFAPRLALSDKATDADRGKAFAPFASFAGTYTVEKDELVFRPLVTMNPNNMRGRPFQPIKIEWADPDVWFVYTGANGIQNRVRLTPVTDEPAD
jgi:hypothetical protein